LLAQNRHSRLWSLQALWNLRKGSASSQAQAQAQAASAQSLRTWGACPRYGVHSTVLEIAREKRLGKQTETTDTVPLPRNCTRMRGANSFLDSQDYSRDCAPDCSPPLQQPRIPASCTQATRSCKMLRFISTCSTSRLCCGFPAYQVGHLRAVYSPANHRRQDLVCP
jgi:hypothetical protein